MEVISAEHLSQWYLTPPSPPRTAVFLRITPMSATVVDVGGLSAAGDDVTGGTKGVSERGVGSAAESRLRAHAFGKRESKVYWSGLHAYFDGTR